MSGTVDKGRRTRWSEIASELTEAIAEGRYPVGTDLPTEAELCATYDVSRFTVREALRSLSDAGLITRRHGSGSRVTATAPPRSYVLGVESEVDVLRYAAETSMSLTGAPGPVTAASARLLRLDQPANWLVVSGVRAMVDGTRIGLIEVHLRHEHAEVLETLGNPVNGAIFSQLLRHYKLTLSGIEQTISAISLKPGQARRLRVQAGEPALRIVRRYLTEEAGVVEVSVSTHPASRFDYSLRINPMRASFSNTGSGPALQ